MQGQQVEGRTKEDMGAQTRLASGVNAVLGIWLIAAPFVLGYSAVTTALYDDIVIGAGVLILAWIRAANPARMTWASWTNLALGLWLASAPFLLGFAGTTAALWNDVIVGLGIAVFALWSALATRDEQS